MTAYLVTYGADPSDRFAAHWFETRAEARAASLTGLVPKVPPDGPAGGCAYVIERGEDVTFGETLLAAVLRSLRGKPEPFGSRALGVQRLIELLGLIPQPNQEMITMPDAMTTTETVAPERGGRTPIYRPNQVISIVPNGTKEKPMKEGKKNYELFQTLKGLPRPITTKSAREAGIPSGYLEFYEKHGLIEIE